MGGVNSRNREKVGGSGPEAPGPDGVGAAGAFEQCEDQSCQAA